MVDFFCKKPVFWLMSATQNPILHRLFNMSLRLSSLGFKLFLTLYIARYFSLSDMGTYGLVASTVAIAIPLLGFRYDYMVTRELVEASPLRAAILIRDETVFYGLNYLFLAAVVLIGMFFIPHNTNNTVVAITLLLSILESLCVVTSTNFVFLKRPILSNFLFFLRSAAWTIPVIGLGLFTPTLRSLNFVFSFWLIGLLGSLIVTAYMLKYMPWKETFKIKVDWPHIRKDVTRCLPIWLGAIGAVGAINIDRFVVEFYMSREMVGVLSFFASFGTALIALVTSGVSTFKQPHLIAHHKQNETLKFWEVAKEITIQSTGAAIFLSLIIGLVVPVMAAMLGKPEIESHKVVLWFILAGSVMRLGSDSLNGVMYARHQDKDIWIGNLLFLAVALLLNLWLVPIFGLYGAGYTALISSLFVVMWRFYCVKRYVPAGHFDKAKSEESVDV